MHEWHNPIVNASMLLVVWVWLRTRKWSQCACPKIHLPHQHGQTWNPRKLIDCVFHVTGTFVTRPPHRWHCSCCKLIETIVWLFVGAEARSRSAEVIITEHLSDFEDVFCDGQVQTSVSSWFKKFQLFPRGFFSATLSSRGRLGFSHLFSVTRWFDFAATFPLWGLNADAQSQLEAIRPAEQPPTLKTTPANQLVPQQGGYLETSGAVFFSLFSTVWTSASCYWCLTVERRKTNGVFRNAKMEVESIVRSSSELFLKHAPQSRCHPCKHAFCRNIRGYFQPPMHTCNVISG